MLLATKFLLIGGVWKVILSERVPGAEELDWENPFEEGIVLPKTGVSVDHFGHERNACFILLLFRLLGC